MTTRSGSEIRHLVVEGSGQGSKLLTNEAITEKYRHLASIVMDDGRVRALEDAVLDLDGDDGARRLIDLLKAPVSPPFA